VADLSKPGGEADGLGGQALGGAVAGPALEGLVEAVADPGAQAQPLGQLGADLADRAQNGPLGLLSGAQGAGKVPHPVDSGSPARLEQQGDGLARVPEVGSLGRGTGTQLVATEVGLLVGGRGAP